MDIALPVLNHISGVLQASEAKGNAYRRFAIIALRLPTLLDTIVSCATEYMHHQGRVPAYINVMRRQKSIQSLRHAVADIFDAAAAPFGDRSGPSISPSPRQRHAQAVSAAEDVFAAVLFQVASVNFAGGKPEAHITAAYQLFDALGFATQRVDGFVQRLLVHRFAIIEVVSSILQRRRPRLAPSFWLFNGDNMQEEELSLGQMTGCPREVLSFLAQVAHLATDATTPDALSSASWEEAESLETRLRVYNQTLIAQCRDVVEEEDLAAASPSSLEGVAEQRLLLKVHWCWYLAAVLILQRRVFKDAAASCRVQRTVGKMIRLMRTVPPTSTIASSLPFPFFLMSREIVRKEDEDWVRAYHRDSHAYYTNPARRAMFALTEQIWDKRRRMVAGQGSVVECEREIEVLERENGIIIF